MFFFFCFFLFLLFFLGCFFFFVHMFVWGVFFGLCLCFSRYFKYIIFVSKISRWGFLRFFFRNNYMIKRLLMPWE